MSKVVKFTSTHVAWIDDRYVLFQRENELVVSDYNNPGAGRHAFALRHWETAVNDPTNAKSTRSELARVQKPKIITPMDNQVSISRRIYSSIRQRLS